MIDIIYTHINEIVLVCEIQECSVTYSHEMPQKLTIQLVSTKRNLQVIDSSEVPLG